MASQKIRSRNRHEAGRRHMTRELKERVEDLRWMLSDPRGRRVFSWFLQSSGMAQLPYAPGDAVHTAFLTGMQNVGNLMQAFVMENLPEFWLQLEGERLQRSQDDAERQEHRDELADEPDPLDAD